MLTRTSEMSSSIQLGIPRIPSWATLNETKTYSGIPSRYLAVIVSLISLCEDFQFCDPDVKNTVEKEARRHCFPDGGQPVCSVSKNSLCKHNVPSSLDSCAASKIRFPFPLKFVLKPEFCFKTVSAKAQYFYNTFAAGSHPIVCNNELFNFQIRPQQPRFSTARAPFVPEPIMMEGCIKGTRTKAGLCKRCPTPPAPRSTLPLLKHAPRLEARSPSRQHRAVSSLRTSTFD